jgi:hypothetical protein
VLPSCRAVVEGAGCAFPLAAAAAAAGVRPCFAALRSALAWRHSPRACEANT